MIMKKIRYIVAVFLLALFCTGCVDERLEQKPSQVEPEEGNVIIDGSLELPITQDQAWTRAFGETPQVLRLYVVVFNAGDILYQIAKAKPGTMSHPTNPEAGFRCGTPEENYLTKFHVELKTVQSGKRFVHFIAVSEPIPSLEEGTVNMMDEATFVHDLVTTDGVVAYWGREEYSAIIATTNMKGIKMIRNFSKATVQLDGGVSNFILDGFRVFDTPVYGTVAPFNNNTGDYITVDGQQQINFDRFANYAEAARRELPYTWMTNTERYHGFMPPIVAYDDKSDTYNTTSDTVEWLEPGEFDYLYECSARPDRNPFLILKGKYQGVTYYYKADFVYKENDENVYYNILRNFKYTLTVTGVSGKGSKTVYDAVNSVALNNFEASTMSQELTNIALDTSRIYVSNSEVLITSGEPFEMYVKSCKGVNYDQDDNANLSAAIKEPTSGNAIVVRDADIVISPTNETSGTYKGWRKVTVTVSNFSNLMKGEVWKQPIVFRNRALSRTVNLTFRRPFGITVDMQDMVAATKDTECELKFFIPAGLTAPMFPLYFYIEQEDNTLYPKALAADDPATLSVLSGPTRIPGRTGNTYFYRRIVTWSEYQEAVADVNGIKTFSCYFKTLKAASATTVWVFPDDVNDFYDHYDHVDKVYTNKDSFVNEKITPDIRFEKSAIQLNVEGQEYNRASSTSGGSISYSSSNTSVATVDASGRVTAVAVGSATITATSASTTLYNAASNTYTVNVTASDLCGLTPRWNRTPTYVVRVGESYKIHAPIVVYDVAQGYDASNVTVTYTTSPAGLISVDETTPELLGYVTITGVSPGTVTVTATVTAADAGGFAGITRVLSYDLQVTSDRAAKGTVFHSQSFLEPTVGDYSIGVDVVTDGATYEVGNNVTAAFAQYTYSSNIRGYRHVWYNKYDPQTETALGLEASAWGSHLAPTEGENGIDYHNTYHASHTTFQSGVIDLSTSSAATLTFEQSANYFYDDNADVINAQAHVVGDTGIIFSADGGETWSEKQPMVNYPTGTSWAYVRSAVDIPAEYLTKDFRFAFDYKSTNARAGSWGIKNVVIKEDY